MPSLPTLALKSSNKVFICYLGNLSNTRSNSSQKLSFTLSILSSVGAWVFRTMTWKQKPLSIMYDIVSLTNSSFLTAEMILLCTKTQYPIHGSYFPFHTKCVLSYWCGATALPPKLTYIWIVPPKLSLGSLPCTYFVHSMFQIQHPYSVALVVYPKNPSKCKAHINLS
jgi:hypothetical protein